ncbi:hypothetical protein PHISCL_02743 [Aspergillus sclerotialis]|uniref:Uncharacterized protein n=1 Tax=Aspergillus sclerotialis TaxID=2070753 RepID=A0A3A3A6C8_9EURO|nr:hypothetical protein PHISCL_02743 [Aspergillus sclerotialis]
MRSNSKLKAIQEVYITYYFITPVAAVSLVVVGHIAFILMASDDLVVAFGGLLFHSRFKDTWQVLQWDEYGVRREELLNLLLR